METGTGFVTEAPPLSDAEAAVWSSLVSEGREIRAPKMAADEERRRQNREAMIRSRGGDPRSGDTWRTKKREGRPVPDGVKRFLVARASGMSFSAACRTCGVTWNDVCDAKRFSEEVMFACDAQEERSRALMRAKAMSVVEQSQEEGARPNMSQVQMAGRILASLDRDHFGEDRGGACRREEDGQRRLGGGGFVINVIGDAAAVCAKPAERTGRALVYTDV